jgi:predicted O-methyltransferase YrrM
MELTKKDLLFSLLVLIFFSGLSIAGWYLIGWPAVFVIVILSLLLIISLILAVFRNFKRDVSKIYSNMASLTRTAETISSNYLIQQRDFSQFEDKVPLIMENLNKQYTDLQIEINTSYTQTESLFSLFSTLHPVLPIPQTRGWAASPDFLNLICELILTRKPALVLEMGSGVSTLIVAYCLKRLGGGKVIALDHHAEYADNTCKLIRMHEMSQYSEIIHAPLKEIQLKDENWLWYDLDHLKIDCGIDLLIVDGPPAATQSQARYPAIPLLYELLSNEAVVVMDDGARKDEKDIIERYKIEFPAFTFQYLNLEKGAFIMTKDEPRL